MAHKMGSGARAVWLVLLAVVGVTVVLPCGVSLVRVGQGALRAGSSVGASEGSDLHSWSAVASAAVIARTLAWSLGIGVCAAILAWPAAWVIRRWRGRALVWLAVPVCMPSYLAYAGYGLMRAPGSALGDWLETMAHSGWREAPVLAGKVLAFGGLTLWTWPFAAVILGLAASRVDEGIFESLRVDGAGLWRRHRALAGAMRRPIMASIGVVGVLMLGSAIPAHLAQVDTWAIKLWFAIDNTPAASRWKVWVLSLPLVVVGAAGAWVIAGWAASGWGNAGGNGSAGRGRGGGRGWVVATAAVWMMGTIVPLALFAWSIRSPGSLVEFWRINDDAAGWSALVAGLTGLMSAVVCAACWMLASSGLGWRRGMLRWAVAGLVAAGLVPGVLVGTLVNETWASWEQTRVVADSYWIVVLAHTARFAWLPAIIGCWLAAIEPVELRMQRLIDGAVDPKGWWLACGRPLWIAAPLAGVLAGLMSLHEIESSVLVQPPGIDGLARRILQFLHFARMEDLSAAGVWLIGGGLVIAMAAAAVGLLTGPKAAADL